ncbi:LuxR C-terminal-related transcriptional regulator [Nonomuraea pusilla]|uniref:DNA-binding response regulator, NarL/FixJ family, contains REC and HTH domains n=1 Tax=Nonomuraea pusilla TaxID=46177 RepID=A0A1H7FVB7_9ACTN|nr:DNA-binding response regulator, NarL/FixJ family, contains REC and HTH domains [Nonomuraea pusilla]
MDIRTPVQDGLTTTELLLSQPDPPRVLVLTTFDADELVLRAAAGRGRLRAEGLARLTERGREVAIELARGRTNAEIAELLHVSVVTVKANITRVFAEPGADNPVLVAMKVRDAGLL